MKRDFEFYETDAEAVHVLQRYIYLQDEVIFEPCVGDGAIARWLKPKYTNDVDHTRQADFYEDAATMVAPVGTSWVVTNPPFSKAFDILRNFYDKQGLSTALFLRLTFLEPTRKVNPRGPWLSQNPPSTLIVLPRRSYTGDKKTDSVTRAWMVWEHGSVPYTHQRIFIHSDPEE